MSRSIHGKAVLLPDRDQHVVAGEVDVGLAGRQQLPAALRVVLRGDLLERDARQPSGVVRDRLRHEEVVDRNALVRRVLLFPRRGLHLVEAGTHDDVHVLAAQALRAAAAVHRRVPAAEHDDPLADAGRVPERHARQPVDADVDARRGFLASRNVDVAPARRPAADEDRVPAFGQQRLQAPDPLSRAELDAEIEHVADLLVDHGLGQPELGNLRAHHAAGAVVAVEHHAVVAERREVARDGQRRRTRADERDALAVLRRGGPGKPVANVFLVVGGNALQPADRHRLGLDPLRVAAFLDPAPPAGGLAGAVAGAPENAGEDVGFPVDEVRIAVTACGDQSDVLGDRRMGGTGPLAIDDFVEIVGVRDIRRLQDIHLQ